MKGDLWKTLRFLNRIIIPFNNFLEYMIRGRYIHLASVVLDEDMPDALPVCSCREPVSLLLCLPVPNRLMISVGSETIRTDEAVLGDFVIMPSFVLAVYLLILTVQDLKSISSHVSAISSPSRKPPNSAIWKNTFCCRRTFLTYQIIQGALTSFDGCLLQLLSGSVLLSCSDPG